MFVLLLILSSIEILWAFQPCVKLQGNESFACICNVTYCDRFDRLGSLEPKTLYLYTSGRDEGRLELTKVAVSSMPNGTDAIISVKTNEPRQEVLGFGGAMTDSAVANIQSLPSDAQTNILEMFFSPEQLHYTIVRVPLACTDFSKRAYTYDDRPYDHLMLRFKLQDEDINGKIPLIKQAEQIAGVTLKLIGGSWSSPAWMKNDSTILSGGYVRPTAYKAWARYYIKFLKAYEKNGLSFWAITNGNEPLTAIVSTAWPPDKMKIFISRYLGPRMAFLFPNVKLLLLDDEPERIKDYLPIMENRNSAKFLSGWAVHPYSGPDLLQSNLDFLHKRLPDSLVLQTEYSIGIGETAVSLGSWSRGERYATNIIMGLQNWAVSFTDWNLALDPSGGPTVANKLDSGLLVNSAKEEWYKQPILYAITHFSAFIPPGSRIVPVDVSPAGILVTAAVTPDKNVVLVLLNKEEKKLNIGVRIEGTSGAAVDVPARSIVTAIYRSNN